MTATPDRPDPWKALEEILAIAADREAFMLQGPRAFAQAESIARAALAAAPGATCRVCGGAGNYLPGDARGGAVACEDCGGTGVEPPSPAPPAPPEPPTETLGTCHMNSTPHGQCHVESWKPLAAAPPSPEPEPEVALTEEVEATIYAWGTAKRGNEAEAAWKVMEAALLAWGRGLAKGGRR